METNALTSAVQTQAQSQKPKSAMSADFDTFLKMLTVQMKNQDPLNPIDSADYAVQLATFSGVEQQAQTNALLGDLGAQFNMMGMAQLATWVGQEARAAGPVFKGDGPVSVTYQAASQADRAVLVVKDADGNLVSREDLSTATQEYEWYGQSANGELLPQGLYSLSVESYSGDIPLGESEVQAYARILEARGGPTGTTVVLQGGVEVPATKVTALRVP